MTDQQLSKPFWYLVNQSDGEPLAQYIEKGGDLANITECDREVLARLVRGKSPRKRGQKLANDNAERDWQICLDVVLLKSSSLPAYTTTSSQDSDACSIVAGRRFVSEATARKAWRKRDGFIKQLDKMYSGSERPDELPDEFERNQVIRKQYIEYLAKRFEG